MKDFVFSIIRTLVPAAAAWVIGLVTDNFGPIIDDSTAAQLTGLLYGVAFGTYYFIVRLLETHVAPQFSWFLGDFRKGLTTPQYAEPDVTVVIPPTGEGGD